MSKYRSSAAAKQARQNKADWDALLDRWDVKPNSKPKTKSNYQISVKRGGSMKEIYKSLDTRASVAAKKKQYEYTGDEMIGVATLHKSNGVPVFRQEDAKDISRMRR